MSRRVLILSWEYPPVIEGGLARHVRKLAEALVRQGVCVDVLTRGVGSEREGDPTWAAEIAGVNVHRVREPGWPRDLDRFVAWVEQMNRDMLAAGEALALEHRYDLVHGHDWLVGQASPTGSACRTSRRSTPPSTGATRAGWTNRRNRTSTPSSAGWRAARTR
jgi:glycosyltransferase involved in cell wall biosynthesis